MAWEPPQGTYRSLPGQGSDQPQQREAEPEGEVYIVGSQTFLRLALNMIIVMELWD